MGSEKTKNAGKTGRSGKALALTGLLALQVVAALFFSMDVLSDLVGFDGGPDGLGHNLVELVAVVALIFGMGSTWREIAQIRARQSRIEAQLRAASGAFQELLDEYFDSWGLTPSERDVALLAIKGLSIAEIAGVRRTREGTIKAQCNAIYSKAGVSGRPQLLSLFIEELMGEGLSARAGREAATA